MKGILSQVNLNGCAEGYIEEYNGKWLKCARINGKWYYSNSAGNVYHVPVSPKEAELLERAYLAHTT